MAIETEEIFPYSIPKKKGLRFVWKANKEAGQTIGNRQVVVPIMKEIFKNDVLPRTQKRYYRGRTIDEKYKDFLNKEPDTYASYVDTGKGWKLTKIDRFDKITFDIAEKEEKDWVRPVDSFDSTEAAEFRKLADSEVPKCQ